MAAAVRAVHRKHPDLRLTGGKKIHELRPGIDWDKGRAVRWLLERLDLAGADVVPLYLGDDVTDEDAFRALRDDGIGVLVGDRAHPTAAQYVLHDPAEVQRFLARLAGVLEER